ncbi:hypothetical protein Scep_026140 [Stephania cephalantha]|uniref:Secreted protein n=1 Tax=Stephania cephalantha TaxID=152367 RepID=A0AAP0EJJ9_9MAGN
MNSGLHNTTRFVLNLCFFFIAAAKEPHFFWYPLTLKDLILEAARAETSDPHVGLSCFKFIFLDLSFEQIR